MSTPNTSITPNTYTLANPASIVPSRSNRKHFDADALQALSDNIKARGIDQPIIIRPLPGSRVDETFPVMLERFGKVLPRPAYEIVSGERRYRAAVMAGLAQVPVILRSYTDAEAIEAQLIENIQRESLSELDEAEGFELWLQQPGITIDVLADKISKSRRYVFSRLQLLKLQPETTRALRTNQIDVSRALLLAPVHDPKLQIKALCYAANKSDGGNGTVPSVRDLSIWLRQNVMLPLDRAPFQITAANLVPLAGSCKSCPKRTGADPDMFSHVDGADICTDPPCYNNKAAEHIANLEFEAKRKGMRLVHGAEAKAACYPNSSTLNGYSPLSQVRMDAGGQRLDNLLTGNKKEPIPGAVLIENPYTKELIPAIPTAEAEAALIAKGLVKQLAEPGIKADKAKGKKNLAADIAELQRESERKIHGRFCDMYRAAVVAKIMQADELGAQAMLSVELLRAFVYQTTLHGTGTDAFEGSGLLNCEDTDDMSPTQVFQATVLLMTHNADTPQRTFANEHAINYSKLRQQAETDFKAEVAAQIAALKPQKTTPPISPLAQPSATPPAHAEVDAKPKTAKPKTKAKLSAKDAQLGIAEAMQGSIAPPTDGAILPLDDAPLYTKGQHVKVKAIREDHEYWRVKYEGKTGKVDAIHKNADDEDLYVITFKGRTGGVADFTADELEAVAA